jgi:acetyl esterase
MPLDPQAVVLLEMMAAAPVPWGQVPAAELRAALAANQVPVTPHELHRVEDRTIPGPAGDLPVRVYWPTAPGAAGSAAPPVVVYFHGGGWVICDLDSHDQSVRRLALDTGAIIVSVDYRLAPEHRFPAAADDCYAATVWTAEHAGELGGDPSRIAVAGDSAGGNLAAVVALMAKERNGPALTFQLLIYPVTGIPADGRPSYTENSEGYMLTHDAMIWFSEQYAATVDDFEHPWFSPTRAKDLTGLPPALVITAGFDPLRDEGEDYGRMLQAAGVACTITRYHGMIHGFFGMDAALDQARVAQLEAAAALTAAFDAGS